MEKFNAIRLTTKVLPGKRIEVTSEEFNEGEEVEIIILMSAQTAPKKPEENSGAADWLQSLPPGPRSAAD